MGILSELRRKRYATIEPRIFKELRLVAARPFATLRFLPCLFAIVRKRPNQFLNCGEIKSLE